MSYAYTALRARAREPGRWFVEMIEIIQPNIRTMDFSAHEPWTNSGNEPVE